MRTHDTDKLAGMTPEQFKEIRKQLGYTQDGLAKIIGYSRAHVVNLEKGHYEIEQTLALLMYLLASVIRKRREEIIYRIWEDYGVKGLDVKNFVHRSAKVWKDDMGLPEHDRHEQEKRAREYRAIKKKK